MDNGGFEPDLFLTEFVNECREATELAVQDILNLEEDRDQESVDRIFRVLHSIKGNSSMLGLMDLSQFVHKVEDTCSDIRSGEREPDKPAINVLLKSFDLIEDIFENVVDNGDDKIDYSAGYKLLENFESGAVSTPAPQPAAAVETPAAVETSAPAEAPVVNETPVSPSEVQSVESEAPQSHESDVRKEPIALIVDDDFASRKILSTYISKHMPCYVAKDGGEAIQAVAESFSGASPTFDLIVMDIMMPNIDGLQACKAIRQMERSRNVDTFGSESKIFIASSLGDKATVHKAVYECQADSYIVKPVTFDELHKQLVRFKLIAPE
ncbi:MAG TPA: hypothetical protein DCS48_11515 [Desulfovibrio sp.]|nr:hypothetical protein [Desulfovibrio sp.]